MPQYRMRLLLLSLALLSGCSPGQPAIPLLAVDAASVMVFGRGVGDGVVSAISGRDCSIVRLDRGQPYCAPIDPPVRDAFCTRSLGTPDCWADPALLPTRRAGIADAPPPSPAQERYRTARWPKSITAQ